MPAVARLVFVVASLTLPIMITAQTTPPADATTGQNENSPRDPTMDAAPTSDADVASSLADLKKQRAALKSENEALRERLRRLEVELGVKPVKDG